MATQAQDVSAWQRKLERRVSFCWALTVSTAAALVIGTAITLIIWATLV